MMQAPAFPRAPKARLRICWALITLMAASACDIIPRKPEPPTNPEFREEGGTIFINWENPIDFKSLEVTLTDPQGTSHRLEGCPTRKGPARAYFRDAGFMDVKPGSYRMEIISNVSNRIEDRRPAPLEGTVDEKRQHYFDCGDLGRTAPEKLSIAYIIHPECLKRWRARKDPKVPPDEVSQQILHFQKVTWDVLSTVFSNVLRIDDENELKRIEKDRETLESTESSQLLWLHDLDALLVVDFRLKEDSPAVPHQLQARLLDLKLARKLGPDYEKLDALGRSLYNRRALVVEGFQEVASVNSRALVRELRDAWKDVLREILDDNPRYRTYQRALSDLEAGKSLKPEDDWLWLFFFGEVRDPLKPFNDTKKTKEWKERLKSIEMRQLFGKVDWRPQPPPSPPPAPATSTPRARTEVSADVSQSVTKSAAAALPSAPPSTSPPPLVEPPRPRVLRSSQGPPVKKKESGKE